MTLFSQARSSRFALTSGTDPGFFLWRGAPLRSGVIEWSSKQILKANTKNKSSLEGRGVRTPYALPLDPPLYLFVEECDFEIVNFWKSTTIPLSLKLRTRLIKNPLSVNCPAISTPKYKNLFFQTSEDECSLHLGLTVVVMKKRFTSEHD